MANTSTRKSSLLDSVLSVLDALALLRMYDVPFLTTTSPLVWFGSQTPGYSQGMNEHTGLITVYRSADSNAEQDAVAVHALLIDNGICAALCGDNVPGTWEVRVAPEDVPQSETLVSTLDADDPGRPDPSADFDSVTIAELQGTTGEIEAMGIKSILDASNIPNVIVGASTLPSLMFAIKVPANEVARAQTVLAEARAAGPAAAVEAERESEGLAPRGY